MPKYKVVFSLYKHLGYNYATYEVEAANTEQAQREALRLHEQEIKKNYRLGEYRVSTTKVTLLPETETPTIPRTFKAPQVIKLFNPNKPKRMKKFKVTLNLHKQQCVNYAHYEVSAANSTEAEVAARRLHSQAIERDRRLGDYTIQSSNIVEILPMREAPKSRGMKLYEVGHINQTSNPNDVMGYELRFMAQICPLSGTLQEATSQPEDWDHVKRLTNKLFLAWNNSNPLEGSVYLGDFHAVVPF